MDAITEQKFKNLTPIYQEITSYEDADDEMQEIAKHIKKTTQHNEYIEPERIKFLYSSKMKKDGGRYAIFDLSKRSDLEKMIENKFDYIVTVFYEVWKDLSVEQRIIQLDKALCHIDMGSMDSPKIGKKSPDSKEFTANMMYYGADKVMKTSEAVDLACQRIMDEIADEKKEKAKAKKGKKNLEQLV